MSSTTLRTRLGRRIREHRMAAQLTQRQLGDRAGGIAAGEIWRFESGKRAPNLDTLHRIAQGLGVPLRALVNFETDELTPSPPPPSEDDGVDMPLSEEFGELLDILERLKTQPPEVVRTVIAAIDALIKVG